MKVFKNNSLHCSYSNMIFCFIVHGVPQEALDFSWSDHVLNDGRVETFVP